MILTPFAILSLIIRPMNCIHCVALFQSKTKQLMQRVYNGNPYLAGPDHEIVLRKV